jgi:CheY-like chemotaxis protein
VLIVDDDAITRMAVSAALNALGYEIAGIATRRRLSGRSMTDPI